MGQITFTPVLLLDYIDIGKLEHQPRSLKCAYTYVCIYFQPCIILMNGKQWRQMNYRADFFAVTGSDRAVKHQAGVKSRSPQQAISVPVAYDYYGYGELLFCTTKVLCGALHVPLSSAWHGYGAVPVGWLSIRSLTALKVFPVTESLCFSCTGNYFIPMFSVGWGFPQAGLTECPHPTKNRDPWLQST